MGQGCPACAKEMSKGEREVAAWLDEHGLPYRREAVFPELTSSMGGRPRFDFFLVNHGVLIEFDGPQHYEPIRMFGVSQRRANESFKRLQANDRPKNEWAAEIGFRLVRIPHWESVANTLNLTLKDLIESP